MTVPGIPVSPTIERLRLAVAEYHGQHGVMGPASDLIDASVGLLNEYDAQVAVVLDSMHRHADAEVVRRESLSPIGSDSKLHEPYERRSGEAKGTLDP